MAGRDDIGKLREQVGTFEAPIGAVQLPSDGVRLDRHGNPKALPSGQDEHPEPARGGARERRAKRQPEPELVFSTDAFAHDPVERAALTACHAVLAGRQITEGELRRKLVAKEFEPEVVDRAVGKCVAAGLIDDERYVAHYVELRVRRGHGAQRIHQDLARRGVDRALVEQVLAVHRDEGDLDQGAVDAARRKFARADLGDAKARTKALRWLMSRGYTSAQCHDALRAVQSERSEAAEG